MSGYLKQFCMVSTHSRLKAAGLTDDALVVLITVSTHSRLKAAGARDKRFTVAAMFQHTAA